MQVLKNNPHEYSITNVTTDRNYSKIIIIRYILQQNSEPGTPTVTCGGTALTPISNATGNDGGLRSRSVIYVVDNVPANTVITSTSDDASMIIGLY